MQPHAPHILATPAEVSRSPQLCWGGQRALRPSVRAALRGPRARTGRLNPPRPRGQPRGCEGPGWPLSLRGEEEPSTRSDRFADPDTCFPEKGFIQSGL